jgi:hypothetical protein
MGNQKPKGFKPYNLASLGRREEALAAIEEAVTIRGRLFQARV